MADTTPTLREAAQRLLNAIEAVHEAEKSEGHARGGFVRTAPTRAHQRRVAEAWHENAAAVQALRAALAEQATHDNLRDTVGQAIHDVLIGWYETEDGTIGVDPFDSRNIDEIADAVIAVLPTAPAAEQAGAIPAGWVPLRMEWEPGYPEDVAFGPPMMMERLKKWLDKHFAAPPAPARQPAAWMHPDGRVVPAATMEAAERDGGAMRSSLAAYTIPLAPITAAPAEGGAA